MEPDETKFMKFMVLREYRDLGRRRLRSTEAVLLAMRKSRIGKPNLTLAQRLCCRKAISRLPNLKA